MISMSDKEFSDLTNYIKLYYGINLTTKKFLVEGRLGNIVIKQGFNSYSQYFKHVFSDPTRTEIKNLVNILTTNHTYFMREPNHFFYFRDNILPKLERNLKIKDLRIWSAGCSTGEEPYTLAMIIDESFGKSKFEWDTKILATDISTKVLDTAINGIYSSEQVESLPDLWKQNYLDKIDGDTYQICKKIRDEVIFRRFNLMEEVFPFKKKFQVILCRNVMIYFDYETKNKLLNKFYDVLEPGGYLFIGYSETINNGDTKFKYVMPSVYQK